VNIPLCAGLASGVITLHWLFILWVIGGAALTRGRRWASGVHIGCLLYGIVIEVSPWPCPLTLLEGSLERCAGEAAYQGSFLLHYLQLLVYPNLPGTVLIAGAVAVCALNLAVYLRRWQRCRQAAAPPAAAARCESQPRP